MDVVSRCGKLGTAMTELSDDQIKAFLEIEQRVTIDEFLARRDAEIRRVLREIDAGNFEIIEDLDDD